MGAPLLLCGGAAIVLGSLLPWGAGADGRLPTLALLFGVLTAVLGIVRATEPRAEIAGGLGALTGLGALAAAAAAHWPFEAPLAAGTAALAVGATAAVAARWL